MPTNRRDWLRSLAALSLGLPLSQYASAENMFSPAPVADGLINLGSNENPYGLSPKAREAIANMIGLSNRYSFNVASLDPFVKTIADYYAVGENQVLVSAGSGDALALAARHFAGGSVVTAKPTFGILPRTARRAGSRVIELPLDDQQRHDLPAMLSAIKPDTKLVYLVNPANPTATMVKPGVLKDFCREASKKAVVLIDEAYIDFPVSPDNESMIGLVHDNPNILVMRTFSKIHGMAGLRVGFTIGHPRLIDSLKANYFASTWFCLSNLSMTAAMASLGDEEHRKMSREKNAAARSYTQEALQQLGFSVIPSYTNFMFFSLGNYAGNFEKEMEKRNIILHSGNFDSSGNWCRVSIGKMDEMKAFLQATREVI